MSGEEEEEEEEEKLAHDNAEIDHRVVDNAGEIIDRLREGVVEGLILPRDASITAGRMGLKALPEGNSNAGAFTALHPGRALPLRAVCPRSSKGTKAASRLT